MCTRQVKKGMQGIDAILYEKKGKGEQHTPSSPHCSGFACIMAEVTRSHLSMITGYPGVFVVTFSRAGEDNKSFK